MGQGQRELKTAARLLILQAAFTVVLAAAGWLYSSSAGVALLAGAGLSLAANGWMAWVVFAPGRVMTRRIVESSNKVLARLYVGETGKFLFVMAGFALAFKFWPVLQEPKYALLMLVAFVVNQALIGLWPLIGGGRQEQAEGKL